MPTVPIKPVNRVALCIGSRICVLRPFTDLASLEPPTRRIVRWVCDRLGRRADTRLKPCRRGSWPKLGRPSRRVLHNPVRGPCQPGAPRARHLICRVTLPGLPVVQVAGLEESACASRRETAVIATWYCRSADFAGGSVLRELKGEALNTSQLHLTCRPSPPPLRLVDRQPGLQQEGSRHFGGEWRVGPLPQEAVRPL